MPHRRHSHRLRIRRARERAINQSEEPVRTLRIPSGDLNTRLKADPSLGLIHLSNVIANQGALPIKIGEETIGGVGASGAPGGEKDEVCVKAGIDKVAAMLN